MSNRKTAVLPLILLAMACLALGCSDDSSGPEPETPTPGEHLWSARFGDSSGFQAGSAVAVDAAGNTVVAGSFSGAVDFGGGALTSAGGSDIFVAKFGPAGVHLWSRRFGDGGEQGEPALAVDTAGNVILAGTFEGGLDFGGGVMVDAGAGDAFVAKLTAAGAHVWSRRFGDGSYQRVVAVDVDASDNVIVAGSFLGAADFGGGVLTSAGNSDVFVARFGSGGSHAWSRRFGDADIQVATGVAVDPAGNVAVAGTFQGSVDFGGGALTSAGQYDLFLAKLEPAGTHLWSRRFGDAQPQVAVAVAVDALGDVFLAGGLVGSVDFGGGSRTSAGSSDVFAARFDAAGSHLWSARFGDAGYQGAEAIAVDAAGNAVITGALQSSANFGGGDLAGAGGDDLFVARFATDGAHRWSRVFGDAVQQVGFGIAVATSGNVAVTGEFEGTIDFGGGPLACAGGSDAFVVLLAP